MRQAVADKFPSSPLARRRAGKPGPNQKHRRVTSAVMIWLRKAPGVGLPKCLPHSEHRPSYYGVRRRLGHECILWASFAFKVHQIAQQFEMDFHAHVPASFKEQAIPVMVRK